MPQRKPDIFSSIGVKLNKRMVRLFSPFLKTVGSKRRKGTCPFSELNSVQYQERRGKIRLRNCNVQMS